MQEPATTEEAGDYPDWLLANGKGLPWKVFALQRKLYGKAKSDPRFRFYTLFGLILRRDVLESAWTLVAANKGAPGVDGVSIEAVESRPGGARGLLDGLEQALRSRSYRPQAVRRVMIPKGNGKLRPLGIPTVADRVVQAAVKLVLEPIFEADFLDSSHGFRPGRGAHEALDALAENLREGRRDVYDADMSSYFDTIPHDRLMAAVERRIADRSVLSLLRMWLTTEVEERDDQGGPPSRHRPTAGTPQGGVISPLLANLYLHWFDKSFHRADGPRDWANARLIRYADDFVILAKHVGTRIREWVETTLEGRFGLTINRTKTRVACLGPARDDTLDFLGRRFRYAHDQYGRGTRYLTEEPSPKAMHAERENLRQIVNAQRCWVPIPLLIAEANRQTRGWKAYHDRGRPRLCFREINRFLVERLTKHLRRRSQRPFRPPKGCSYCEHLTRNLGLELL